MKAFLARAPDRTQPFFTLRSRSETSLPFLWHFHREFELTHIVDGEGARFVADSVEDYRSGDLVLTGPLVPHSWSSHTRGEGARDRSLVAHFGDDVLGSERLRHPTMIDIKGLLDDAGFGLAFPSPVAADVGRRLTELPGRSALGQLAGLLEVLDLLAGCRDRRRLASRRIDARALGHAAAANDPMARVLEFLNEHYVRGVSLDEAAQVAAMSPSAFSRAFRRATGKTLVRYLNDVRIAHACQLILETNRTMADIAESAGFGSVTYFNRRFRMAKKQQPSEYRRRGLVAKRTR